MTPEPLEQGDDRADGGFTADYARIEGGFRVKNLWLLGGAIRRDSVRLPAPTVFNTMNPDSAYVPRDELSATGATLAISTFAFWSVVLGWASYYFPRLKGALEGHPRVIICQGKLIEENLRRDRMTRSEVESEMRLAGIGAINDVAWAILEPSGKISFIKCDRDEASTMCPPVDAMP